MNTDNTPLVTAVIPIYNHEQYVVESIRSILDQTYPNIELIILNDGSTDRSHEMVLTCIEECKQRFVRFEYINRENIGLSATLNQALGMARGVYFSALASDDVASPEKIQMLVDALEEKGTTYAAAFGNASFINGSGQEVELMLNGAIRRIYNKNSSQTFLDFYTKRLNFDYRSEVFGTYRTLLAANYLPAMSNIVRTKAIQEVGGWTDGNILEDWEMWLKLSKQSKFLYVDQLLALYRLHGLNSWSTMTHKFVSSSLALILKEKVYCSQNCLMSSWEDSLNSQFFVLFRKGMFLLNRNMVPLKSFDALSFFLFSMRKVGTKAREVVSRNNA